jgi:serine/threonine protein phosphatase 1
MSKWRPTSTDCLYVIPDIHGNVDLLNKILKRILPLRKSDGGKDRLIFLGDYIDRHIHSHLVLDKLIELKTKYPDQVICLRGNHEDLMLRGLNSLPDKQLSLQDIGINYRCWMNNGGIETVVGYMQRAGIDTNGALTIDRHRIPDLIPPAHLKFLQQDLDNYWVHENYVFVHAGYDPAEEISQQDPGVLLWDRNLCGFMLKCIDHNQPVSWEETIVTGHNVMSDKPIIHPKYLMLDCGSPRRLLVIELRSMTGYMAYPTKDRLVKTPLVTTTAQPRKVGSFRRAE